MLRARGTKQGAQNQPRYFVRFQWGKTGAGQADVTLSTPENAQFSYQPQAFRFDFPADEIFGQHRGIAPDRIGMIGFSAGSTVTVSVALEHDAGSRPDFAAAIHDAGRQDVPLPADAPPLFILCAGDDLMASPNSVRLYSDWKAAGRPVELHICSKGGHGLGINKQGLPSDTRIDRYGDWLQLLY